MGYTIRCMQEAKINDRWEHAGEIEVNRSSELVDKIYNINDIPDVEGTEKAKGYPGDVNPFSKFKFGYYGDYAPTYLDLDEINILYRWLRINDHSNPLYDGMSNAFFWVTLNTIQDYRLIFNIGC